MRDGYQERDKGVYPTQASWNSYEIVYDSFDGTNYYWDVLVNGNRIEQVINNDLQTTAQALVGGETVAHINNEIDIGAAGGPTSGTLCRVDRVDASIDGFCTRRCHDMH